MTSNILEETLKREIMEEVGIVVSNLRYVNSSLFETDKGLTVVDIVFLCEHQSGEPYAKCLDEVSEVFWMSMQEILNDVEIPVYLKENMKLSDNFMQHQLAKGEKKIDYYRTC